MVSVVMPSYNSEKYIAESIESILKQTYSDFELIVVNDGSVDKTKDIVREYIKRDNRVHMIEQRNQGVSVARNTGIEASKGEYISFLDADDVWDKDFLYSVMEYADQNKEACFIYARTMECFLNGKKNIIGTAEIKEGFFEDFIAPNNEMRLTFHMSGILVKKCILHKYDIKFVPGLRLSEDTGFYLELLSCTKVYAVNKVLTYYVRRDDSATSIEWKPDFWKGHVEVYEYIESFVEKHRPQAMVAFKKARGYVAYRFILSCIKHGYIDEGIKYRKRWISWLKDFAHGDGKIKDRIKCRLIIKSGRSSLKIIGKF